MAVMIRLLLFLALGILVAACSPTNAKQDAFLIVTEGQSNNGRGPSAPWTPPPNLLEWSYWGHHHPADYVGRFQPPTGRHMSVGLAFAAEYAREHPTAKVYLVEFAVGGIPIASWLPKPSTYDMRKAIVGNLPLAIKAVGRKPDVLLWNQGQSDSGRAAQYPSDFRAVMNWHIAQGYLAPRTPTLIFGVSPWVNASQTAFNNTLMKIAATDWNTLYIDLPSLPKTIWDSADTPPSIHLSIAGRLTSGRFGYRKFRQLQ